MKLSPEEKDILSDIASDTAILNAMRSDRRYNVPQSVRVLLVLQSSLPLPLRAVAEVLGIDFRENVTPTDGESTP